MVEIQPTRMKTVTYPDLDALKAKLQDRTATATVIGLVTLAYRWRSRLHRPASKWSGSMSNRKRLRCSKQANLTSETLLTKRLLRPSGRFSPTAEFAALRDVDTVSTCVPTPLSRVGIIQTSLSSRAVDNKKMYLFADDEDPCRERPCTPAAVAQPVFFVDVVCMAEPGRLSECMFDRA